MPERTSYPAGTPSWVDLQTSDPAGAKSFYTALFGWDYDDQPVPDGGVYSLALRHGRRVAAIGGLPPGGVPPHWNTYVTVASVDATCEKVPAAGGTVVMAPFDVMDAGRMALIADPTGAMLCPWQPKEAIGAELVNEHGTLTWNELLTPDIPAATKFYAAVFGWTANAVDAGGMAYTELKLGDRAVGGAMNPPMPGMPPVWGIYFAVDDTDKVVEIATAGGGAVLQPPTDIPPGRMAVIADPAGAVFSVIRMLTPGD